MTRFERKLLIQTGLLGVALTIFIACMDQFGLLRTLELILDDYRSAHYQNFRTRPTDKLVHLDIDDTSVKFIGRFPWPREVWAKILHELDLAGAKVVDMDVLFTETEDPTIQKDGTIVDHDQLLAQAMNTFRRQPGRGVLAPSTININDPAPGSELYKALLEEFEKNLELDDADLLQRIQARGFNDPQVRQRVTALAGSALTEVMFRRVKHELDSGHGADVDSLRKALLPHSYATGMVTDAMRTLEQVLPPVQSYEALLRFTRTRPAGLPALLSQDTESAPIPPVAQAAAFSGFVDFWKLDDEKIRSIPLWIMERGRLVPQMGLSLACAELGVNPNDLKLAPDSVTIPVPDGEPIVIPVYSRKNDTGVEGGMIMDIPWFGTSDWRTMYDWPDHVLPLQHIPVAKIWDICRIEPDILSNNQKALEEIAKLSADQGIRQNHPDFADTSAWNKLMADTLASVDADTMAFYKPYVTGTAKIETLTDQRDLDNVAAIRNLQTRPEVNRTLGKARTDQRSELRRLLQDKAVLVGEIETGGTDFKPTPLQKECPGAVMHGAIFNAIMTRDLLSRAPRSVSLFLTLFVGLLVSFASAAFPPFRALTSAFLIAIVFLWINFYVAYDKYRVEVDAAGPPTAAGLIWTMCTLTRFIREQKEKKHITERFRTYVDPNLVKYVLEHPEKATLEGEERELSVVFTDLQGFTSVSEVLKRETVSLLNEYLGLMVPVISRHHGYLNKFLGDGVMFFFGAPEPYPGNPQLHAYAAVETVVEMQRVMVPFNKELARRSLPALKMRAGVSTGDMVVGDAGAPGRADYTVLGDRVNFAARLESANKYTGTLILISDRTVELLENRYLVRPIGRLQVVGKNEPVMTYEPLATVESATDEMRKLVDMTMLVTDSYAAAKFADCIAATHELLTTYGEEKQGKFCGLYRRLCMEYLRVPPKDFRGQIKLEAK